MCNENYMDYFNIDWAQPLMQPFLKMFKVVQCTPSFILYIAVNNTEGSKSDGPVVKRPLQDLAVQFKPWWREKIYGRSLFSQAGICIFVRIQAHNVSGVCS